MNLRLLHPGGHPSGPLDAAAEGYRARLGRHIKTDEVYIKPARLRNASVPEVKRVLADEGKRLLARVGARDLLIALDRTGKPQSSEKTATDLGQWMHEGYASVTFVLGSAHGLDPSVVAKARRRWSFGPLTLPHDLARVVLWEQLYRANTILRGEPYHK